MNVPIKVSCRWIMAVGLGLLARTSAAAAENTAMPPERLLLYTQAAQGYYENLRYLMGLSVNFQCAIPAMGYSTAWSQHLLGLNGGCVYAIANGGALECMDLAKGVLVRIAQIPADYVYNDPYLWVVLPDAPKNIRQYPAHSMGVCCSFGDCVPMDYAPDMENSAPLAPESQALASYSPLIRCYDLKRHLTRDLFPDALAENDRVLGIKQNNSGAFPLIVVSTPSDLPEYDAVKLLAFTQNAGNLEMKEVTVYTPLPSDTWGFASSMIVWDIGYFGTFIVRNPSRDNYAQPSETALAAIEPLGADRYALFANKLRTSADTFAADTLTGQALFIWDAAANAIVNVALPPKESTPASASLPQYRDENYCLKRAGDAYTLKKFDEDASMRPGDSAGQSPEETIVQLGHGYNTAPGDWQGKQLHLFSTPLGYFVGPLANNLGMLLPLRDDWSAVAWHGDSAGRSNALESFDLYEGEPRELVHTGDPIGTAPLDVFDPAQTSPEGDWKPWTETPVNDAVSIVNGFDEWNAYVAERRKKLDQFQAASSEKRSAIDTILSDADCMKGFKELFDALNGLVSEKDKDKVEMMTNRIVSKEKLYNISSKEERESFRDFCLEIIERAARDTDKSDAAQQAEKMVHTLEDTYLAEIAKLSEDMEAAEKEYQEYRQNDRTRAFWLPKENIAALATLGDIQRQPQPFSCVPSNTECFAGETVELTVAVANHSEKGDWVAPPSFLLGNLRGFVVNAAEKKPANEVLEEKDAPQTKVFLKKGDSCERILTLRCNYPGECRIALVYRPETKSIVEEPNQLGMAFVGIPPQRRGIVQTATDTYYINEYGKRCRLENNFNYMAPVIAIQIKQSPNAAENAQPYLPLIETYLKLNSRSSGDDDTRKSLLQRIAVQGEPALQAMLDAYLKGSREDFVVSNILEAFDSKLVYDYFSARLDAVDDEILMEFLRLMANYSAEILHPRGALTSEEIDALFQSILQGNDERQIRALLHCHTGQVYFGKESLDTLRDLRKRIPSLEQDTVEALLNATYPETTQYSEEIQEYVHFLLANDREKRSGALVRNSLSRIFNKNKALQTDRQLLRDMDLCAPDIYHHFYDMSVFAWEWLRRAAEDPTEARYLLCEKYVKALEKETGTSFGAWPGKSWKEVNAAPDSLKAFSALINAWADYVEKNPVSVRIP